MNSYDLPELVREAGDQSEKQESCGACGASRGPHKRGIPRNVSLLIPGNISLLLPGMNNATVLGDVDDSCDRIRVQGVRVPEFDFGCALFSLCNCV